VVTRLQSRLDEAEVGWVLMVGESNQAWLIEGRRRRSTGHCGRLRRDKVPREKGSEALDRGLESRQIDITTVSSPQLVIFQNQ